MRSLCILLVSCALSAQVSVREHSTTVHLAKAPTTVSIALTNSGGAELEAVVALGWVRPEVEPKITIRRTVQLKPGESKIEIPLPLPAVGNPLTERLFYRVVPGVKNYIAFAPQQGMLSLPEIADNAFALSVVVLDVPRPGRTYPIHVFALHPVTRKPVDGVEIRCGNVSTATGPDGMAVLQIPVGESDEGNSVTVEGKLGDYLQLHEVWLRANPDTVNIYTDKPLYQPGQTMHVRTLSLSSAGPVEANVSYEIRVVDENDDVQFQTKATTSRFGVASANWAIPANANSGQYTIEVQREGLDSVIRHEIEIRRYELPSFRVSAKPEHAFYLTGERAVIDVAAEYLFGKPVEKGTARVTAEDSDKTIATGELDSGGHFRATLDAGQLPEQEQYSDRDLIAYVTDRSTNRTEQRKFDLRVSRFPLNIYIAKREQTQRNEIVYVSVSSPDGQPARAAVGVTGDGKTLAEGETNRFGLARLTFARGDYHTLTARASTKTGNADQSFPAPRDADTGIWLETEQALYRAGQPVRCHITCETKDAPVLLVSWNTDGHIVFSTKLTLNDGIADVVIPYDPSFSSQLSIGVASPMLNGSAARSVVFAGAPAFKVRAAAGQASYRPGDLATIRFESSKAAALGVAIVDESVFERVQTDEVPRRWFDYSAEPEIAGIRARDLAGIDPSRIDNDLQVLAAVLLPIPAFASEGEDLQADIQSAFRQNIQQSLAPFKDALDRHYADTLQFPSSEEELRSVLGYQYTTGADPWMEPWRSEFAIDGSDYVIRLTSSGPDKRPGTADDLVALEMRKNWLAPYQALIAQNLKQLPDYPATADDFKAVIRKAGIDFDELRDPWQSPLRIAIGYKARNRIIRVLSAGPDRKWDTRDDVTAVEFSGFYFRAEERRIRQAIFANPSFPKNEADVRTRLRAGGIDFDSLRDPWGRPYYIALSTEESWSDHIETYSYAEYQRPAEERGLITPIKRHFVVLQIRSAGEDGLRGTDDDFSATEFRHSAENNKPTRLSEQLKELPPDHVAGAGTIRGQVLDPTGAPIPNAHVILNALYDVETNRNGEYEFSALSPGLYELRAEAHGFERFELVDVPVQADRITPANIVLRVGSMAQSVEVSPNKVRAISTPRVREYFPETLFWTPEIDTSGNGTASVQVKLADSVTTWHLAVIASTMDGKIAEGGAEIRAFQPLMADLDLPQVLTAGDSVSIPVPIRNYTGQPQRVTVSSELPAALKPAETAGERLTIPASGSADAVLPLRALSSVQHAAVQVTVIGPNASDAIKKTLDIHPDGERRELVVNGVSAASRPMQLAIPAAAIPDSIQAQVTVFPSLLSRILAAMSALLTRPYGCAEQTISSTYPNLLFLRALHEQKLDGGDLAIRAEKNLRDGYERLLNYQGADGGFSYWSRQDSPDVALTAYAIRFLQDAKQIIPIDEERLETARKWLGKQPAGDPAVRALQLRSLLRLGGVADADDALGNLARAAARTNDPYALAQFALAAMSAGKPEAARRAIADLQKSANDEQGTAYWDLHANTPFYGWGGSGRIEMTAVVISALAKWRDTHGDNSELSALIDRGVLFLFRHAGSDGAWPTTQATVQALDALLSVWKGIERRASTTLTLSVNNGPGMPVPLERSDKLQGPVTLDISKFVRPGEPNQISFAGASDTAIQVQATASWYEPWSQPEQAKTLEFAANCGPRALAINELSECDVSIGRTSFRGYGMLIANIGLPPGAEVDRGGLTALVEAGTIDSFEIAPDHVGIYAWPEAAGTHFKFCFRPRFAMHAKAAQSVLYDYYNPDEKIVLQPREFQVK